MTDHRPECIYTPEHFDPEQNIVWGGKPCICEELRACEQRVNSSNLTMWNHTQEEAQHMINAGLGIAWKDGFKEGLDAAREALVIAERRLHFDGEDNRWIVEIDALAAIDALREKP